MYNTYSTRGSCIANEGAGCKCTRTIFDDHCTTKLFKDERNQRNKQKNCMYKKVYVGHSMRGQHMKEEEDNDMNEKIR